MNATEQIYGFLIPSLDAHTMGLVNAAGLLRECGYQAVIAPEKVCQALDDYRNEARLDEVVAWLVATKISHLGFSYRLDNDGALAIFGALVARLQHHGLANQKNAQIVQLYFGSLEPACQKVQAQFPTRVITFAGGETRLETLKKMGVVTTKIPQSLLADSAYDRRRLDFAAKFIAKGGYDKLERMRNYDYPEYGTSKDTIEARLNAQGHVEPNQPLVRAHVGPYHPERSRSDSVEEFKTWTAKLAQGGLA